MHHPHHYVLSLYWARWARVQSTSQPMPSDPDRVSEWRCDGWEGKHSMQRTIYITTQSGRWDHWPKWKMHGAAREEGDLIFMPNHRAGEKGVEGGSKTKRAPWCSNGAHEQKQKQGRESQWRIVCCLANDASLAHVFFTWQSRDSNLCSYFAMMRIVISVSACLYLSPMMEHRAPWWNERPHDASSDQCICPCIIQTTSL